MTTSRQLSPRVPVAVAREAAELRRPRRTGSGVRLVPWHQIAAELQRRGRGDFTSGALLDAVSALPLRDHELAPTPADALAAIELSFRDGWAEDFPGEPWPGLAAAKRRLREKLR